MALYNKFQAFAAEVFHGTHDFSSDTVKIALCAAANAPVATDAVLADLTQINYTNLVSQTPTVNTEGQTAGVYNFILDDFTLEASGGPVGPFRYVVLYNDTPAADPLISWYDIGQEVTLADSETLLLDFNNADGVFSFQ